MAQEDNQQESNTGTGLNQPRIGMNLDSNPIDLTGGEFSLLVNGNLMSTDGNIIKITNEPSSLLCSRFKPGFKVIGKPLYVPTHKLTIFFLVNPITNSSEIGMITNTYYDDVNDRAIDCPDCNHPIIEDIPLEKTVQTPLCNYITIVNASCLNFNINYPIDSTYEIGVDVLTQLPDCNNITIFFTDYLNPRRFINLKDIPAQIIGYASGSCHQPIYNGFLDCNEILVAPNYTDGCIISTEIRSGGQNKAGAYQFAAEYCNAIGNPVSDCFIVSNPVTIWDIGKSVTDKTDYITGQSIAININNIDEKFLYFKLIVAKTINNVTTAYQVGIFPINSTNFIYTYTGSNSSKELPVPLQELLNRRTLYTAAKGVMKSNDILFWYNLKEQRIINLQPVVNNLRLQWQTIEANEGIYPHTFYSDGTNVANNLGFERDEVYTFGIEYRTDTGYKTPTFLISANDAAYLQSNYQLGQVLHNGGSSPLNVFKEFPNDPNVIQDGGCSGTRNDQLWQIYNTAINLGTTCGYIPGGTTTIPQFGYFTCESPTWEDGQTPFDDCGCQASIPSGYIPYPDPINYKQIITVSPSGLTTIYEYNITPPASPSTFITFGDNPLVQTGWTLQNTTCQNAQQTYAGPGVACLKDPNTGQPYTYGQLDAISNPVSGIPANTQPGVPAGSSIFYNGGYPFANHNWIPVGSGFTDNSIWFTLTATSTTLLINLWINICTVYDLVVAVYDGENGCPSDTQIPDYCSRSFWQLIGDVNAGQNPLIVGHTYYIRIFTLNPQSITSTIVGGNCNAPNFGVVALCISKPTPTGNHQGVVPAIYQLVCNYRSSTPTIFTANSNSNCNKQVYQFGEFAYWQSTSLYPNNPDVWGDLCGKPIRHHKFPDCNVSPLHDNPYTGANTQTGYATNNKIYPIGVRLDTNKVKQVLLDGVTRGLLTLEEAHSITGFSIKRGNRRSNRSVVAKGLLYDIWNTPNLNADGSSIGGLPENIYYPNYPYNDQFPDGFIRRKLNGSSINPPYNGRNGRYSFQSPNTSFNKPFLSSGQELKLETAEFGYAKGTFEYVYNHGEYILLSPGAYALAEGLSAAEIVLEAANYSFAAGTLIGFIVEFIIGLALGFATNQGKYTKEWTDIFTKMGTPKNPAIYYSSVGKYNGYKPVLNFGTASPLYLKRSSIATGLYLQPGYFDFEDQNNLIRFNNFERESSVYLSIPTFNPDGTIIPNKAFNSSSVVNNWVDSSRQDLQLFMFDTGCQLGVDIYDKTQINSTTTPLNQISSYYASIKNYVPDQYGTPDQIEWIDTGYCGRIDWSASGISACTPSGVSSTPSGCPICETIFGGDTFINRFAVKRKFPFFTQTNLIGVAPNTPIQFGILGNIGKPAYFMDSFPVDPSAAQVFFQFTPPTTNFICNQSTPFYQRGYFPEYMYGIPYFICESDYNTDLRYGEDELIKNFYPNVGDVVNWTQEYHNPIYNDNFFGYNNDYSLQNFLNFSYILKNNFSNLTDACQTLHPTRTIWSPQGTYFWLNYLAADFFDFPREDGTVMIMKELEELKILVIQEQSNKVFNNYNTLNTNGITIAVESGSLFKDLNNKPSQIYATDLGFGGTQNFAIESTPKGTFYVDTRNPAILSVTRTMYGRNVTNDVLEAKEGKTKVTLWMRQNLPFQIIKDYDGVDINNVYKYFGIATCWDNKFDRLFITKRDARVRPEWKNKIIFDSSVQEFYLNQNGVKTLVLPTDERYFCDKSFSIMYNPTLGEFIGFSTSQPNYYNGVETYFQKGFNFPIDQDINKIGLWDYNKTQKSYQVYEGELMPFIFEYVLKDTITNTLLNGITVNAEFYRYQSNLNFYMMNGVFMNKALIYNQTQSSGNLNLVVTQKNNLYQLISYPKYNIDSRDILVENVSNLWNFNNYNNVARLNVQPMNLFSCNNVMWKEPNPLAMNYAQVYLPNKIKGDYYSVRLINDIYSNYKIIMKHGLNSETKTI